MQISEIITMFVIFIAIVLICSMIERLFHKRK